MDDAKDEVNRLLSTGLWEKLWNGTITPFEFYAGKYAEDTSNEAMAGEPGFPVQNIGETMAAAPLMRVPYWDPCFNIGDKRVSFNSDRLIYLSSSDANDAYTWQIEQNISDMIEQVMAASKVLSGLSRLIHSAITAASVAGGTPMTFANFMTSLVEITFQQGMYVLADKVILAFVKAAQNGDIYSFGGSNLYNFSVGPFANMNCTFYTMVFTKSKIIQEIQTLLVVISAMSGIYGVYAGIYFTGAIMALMKFFPPVEAAGRTIIGACDTAYSAFMSINMVAMVSYWISLINYVYSIEVTRHNGERIRIWNNAFGPNTKDLPTYWAGRFPVSSSTKESGQTSGLLTTYDFGVDLGNEGLNGIVEGIMGLIQLLSMPLTLVLQNIDPSNLKEAKYFCYSSFNSRQSSLYIIPAYQKSADVGNKGASQIFNYYNNMQDWWRTPVLPQVSANINDVASEYVGWVSYAPLNLMYVTKLQLSADVYSYDYYGTNKGITIFKGKVIDKTIVIRAKADVKDRNGGNHTYYGICNLVRFSGGSKLYLLWEREALYSHSYHCKHIEQMIYNYDKDNLPVGNTLTSNRNGQLSYVYVVDQVTPEDPEVTVIFKNVQKAWPNYLNGQLINTEYTFGPMTYLTANPTHSSEGFLNSYCG